LLEHALVTIAEIESTELSLAHAEFIEELTDFFYYGIWRYPCLLISRETATGPSAAAVRERRTNQLRSFEDELAARHASLQQQFQGLPSTDADFVEPVPTQEQHEQLTRLTEEYLE
jgi:hypothetical protein